MQVNWQFNANQYEPKQGMEGHPPALKIPFTITSTEIKPTKDSTPNNSSGYLAVEFTSSLGSIIHRYNINNASPKAVEIAYQQLSALCRAVNIYQIDGNNECAALRGGKGLMDVGYQKGEEPSPDNPNAKGYTELKRVYDMAGNDPSKPAQASQQPQQGFAQPQQNVAQPQGQPLQQQPGGGWGQPNQQPQQAPQQAPNAAPQGQAWTPGGGQPNADPPWGSR